MTFVFDWLCMSYLVLAVLVVLYPLRGYLHLNYDIIVAGFPYFMGVPFIVLAFAGSPRGDDDG